MLPEKDEKISVRDPAAFAATIRDYRGDPGNCMSLVQLWLSNENEFTTDPTGTRWRNVLQFIKDAGGPQWQVNVFDFIKDGAPKLNDQARDAQFEFMNALVKEWEQFCTVNPTARTTYKKRIGKDGKVRYDDVRAQPRRYSIDEPEEQSKEKPRSLLGRLFSKS